MWSEQGEAKLNNTLNNSKGVVDGGLGRELGRAWIGNLWGTFVWEHERGKYGLI